MRRCLPQGSSGKGGEVRAGTEESPYAELLTDERLKVRLNNYLFPF